jgi:hypothetical protein
MHILTHIFWKSYIHYMPKHLLMSIQFYISYEIKNEKYLSNPNLLKTTHITIFLKNGYNLRFISKSISSSLFFSSSMNFMNNNSKKNSHYLFENQVLFLLLMFYITIQISHPLDFK